MWYSIPWVSECHSAIFVRISLNHVAYEYKERTLNPQSRVLRRDGKGHYIHVGGSSPQIGLGDPESDPLGLSVPEARLDKLFSHFWQQWSSSVSHTIGLSSNEIHYHVVFVRPNGEKLKRVSKYVEEGKIRSSIERTFPLHEIGSAHDYVEEGHTLGKIVITIP
jgi:NADPH:quinone reductase-like Zn-dependent oxidoreductase